MSALWQVQTAVYGALTAALPTAKIYSIGNAPDSENGVYSVIGDSSAVADDTDQRLGFQVSTTVHTWEFNSSTRGFKNVEARMKEIYQTLNRAALAVSGYTLVDCFFEFEQAMIDSDGLTPHGVQRFKVLLTEL